MYDVRCTYVYPTYLVCICVLVTQHNCDPRFFTTVVFYVGSVSMATMLKFEVFDVFNRKEHQMNPIGQAQCEVKELLMSMEQVMRLPVLYDGAICGYLTVRAWRVRNEWTPWSDQ